MEINLDLFQKIKSLTLSYGFGGGILVSGLFLAILIVLGEAQKMAILDVALMFIGVGAVWLIGTGMIIRNGELAEAEAKVAAIAAEIANRTEHGNHYNGNDRQPKEGIAATIDQATKQIKKPE